MTLLGPEPMGGGIVAKVYSDLRTASRIPAQRPITLRSFENEPIDALVEDLSRSGFAMSTIADLELGSEIGLSIGGVLRRRVRVVRRVGLAYGCEFLSPLSDLEVKSAFLAGDVIAPVFASDDALLRPKNGSEQAAGPKLSVLARAYVIGGMIVALWMALYFVVRRSSAL